MKLVAESLGEFIGKSQKIYEFEKGKDPKEAMGIGLINSIKDWMRKNTHYNVDEKPAQYSWRKPPTVYSLLWLCVKHDKPEWVKALLKRGMDVHENNDAALRWACGWGMKEMVGILLDAGANPDAKGPSGDAEAYRWAKRDGHSEIVRMLDMSKAGYTFTDKGPNFEIPDEETQRGVSKNAPPVPARPVDRSEDDGEDVEEEDEEKGSWI
jgi:hypothetical protein